MYTLIAHYDHAQHMTIPNLTFVQCLRYIRKNRAALWFSVYRCDLLAWEFKLTGTYLIPCFTNKVFI